MPLDDTDLKYKDVSIKGGRHTSRGKLENMTKTHSENANETNNRNTDQTRDYDTQRLTAAERGQLWSDIGDQSADRDETYYADRKKIKIWADNDHKRSIGIGGVIEAATQSKLEAAGTQLDKKLNSMLNYLGRTAGSTRNCFVAHVIADVTKDFQLQTAISMADATIKGINSETDARRVSFTEGAAAFLDSNDKEQLQIDSKYGILKDALQTHHEKQLTVDVNVRNLTRNISENVLTIGAELFSEGWAEDRTDAAGAYAGKADEWATAGTSL